MLFALREAPQDSLGLSPFELLFGRQIRGILNIDKDCLLQPQPDKSKTVSEYLSQLQATLSQARRIAKDSLLNSQRTVKYHYDFMVIKCLLVYNPLPGSIVSTKSDGTYEVISKLTHSICGLHFYNLPWGICHCIFTISFSRN